MRTWEHVIFIASFFSHSFRKSIITCASETGVQDGSRQHEQRSARSLGKRSCECPHARRKPCRGRGGEHIRRSSACLPGERTFGW